MKWNYYLQIKNMTTQIRIILRRATALLLVAVFGLQLVSMLPAEAARPKGYLEVYNQQGRYNGVRISVNQGVVTDLPDFISDHRCGGTFNAGNSYGANRKLTSRTGVTIPPKRFKCTPAAAGAYRVQYMKNGQTVGDAHAVDISDGICTTIHPGGATSQRALVGGVCTGTEADTPTQLGSASAFGYRVGQTSYLSKNKRSIYGVIKVTPSNGEDLLKPQCVGTVTITYAAGKSNTAPTKLIKQGNGQSYCQAKFNSKNQNLSAGTYNVTATFGDNTYLAASTTSSLEVTIPKRR